MVSDGLRIAMTRLSEHIHIREDADGGFAPICRCGSEMTEFGSLAIVGTELQALCPSCLVAQRGAQRINTAEAISLVMARLGYIPNWDELPDGEYRIAWRPKQEA